MATEWHHSRDGKHFGPVPDDQMRRLAASGELLPTDLVWQEGIAGWTPAGQIQGLLSSPADEWYYSEGGQKIGPVTSSQIKKLVHQRGLDREALIWKEGMPDW